jgi:hypothetical protein
MPSTDRKLELKAKTSVAQTGSQPFVYAKGLIQLWISNVRVDTFSDFVDITSERMGTDRQHIQHVDFAHTKYHKSFPGSLCRPMYCTLHFVEYCYIFPTQKNDKILLVSHL